MNKTLKIFGIGIDIASISRFENILNRKIALPFMKKVLHKKEL
jgi:phosphopantetheinyl transferase (holo-ACP synthase)